MTKNKITYVSEAYKTFHNKNGFEIGRFSEGIFRKNIKGSLHILRKTRSLGIDVGVVQELTDLGAYEIRIRDVENGAIYSIPMTTFKENATKQNYGYGDQLFCPLDKFTMK